MTDIPGAPRGNDDPMERETDDAYWAVMASGPTAAGVAEIICKACQTVIETRRGGGGPG